MAKPCLMACEDTAYDSKGSAGMIASRLSKANLPPLGSRQCQVIGLLFWDCPEHIVASPALVSVGEALQLGGFIGIALADVQIEL